MFGDGERQSTYNFEYLDSAMPEGYTNYQLNEPTNTSPSFLFYFIFLTSVYITVTQRILSKSRS